MLLSVGCDIGVCIMNYDDMSDYKINRKIAWLIFGADKIIHRNPKSQSSILMHGMQGELDYCNSPSDAWPIIVENKISLTTSCGVNWNADVILTINPNNDDNSIFECESSTGINSNKNPLRAAMICFLEMKDAENETSN